MAEFDPREILWHFAQQTREHAIVLIDTEGRIAWVNPGAERIFGYPADQIVGQPSAQLFVPEDIEKGMDRLELAVADSDRVAEDDRWQRRADGSRFWASGIMLAVQDREGHRLGYAKVLRDRTDLREQVETLHNQVVDLELDRKRKDVFLSTLSHELRNPLAPLSNAVTIIRSARETPAPETEYALRVIERQMELLRRLVDDLLDVARLGAGKMEVGRERVVINDVLAQAVESTRALAQQQRQHRVDLVMPEVPIAVDGDADRLLQVFVNLLNNAAKYTPPGGHIHVHATIEGHEAVVHVRDNGVGIPTDMLPRIFDLFTQVDSARQYSQGGLGIGLTLVKNLVALHGGIVQVRSDGEGKGAEFSVRLPLRSD